MRAGLPPHLLPGGLERLDLGLAPHERRVETSCAAGNPGPHREQPPRFDALCLALGLDRRNLGDIDRVANQLVGQSAQEDLARRAACSSRGGRVHGVSGDERRRPFEPSPATTSPVFTPVRNTIWEAALGRQLPGPLPSAHHGSRRRGPRGQASSSCTSGTPDTAMMASPMNFSTSRRGLHDRPHPGEIPRHERPERLRVEAVPSAVDPATSANRTVTTLRVSRAASVCVGWRSPHAGQNFAPGATSAPQSGHAIAIAEVSGLDPAAARPPRTRLLRCLPSAR